MPLGVKPPDFLSIGVNAFNESPSVARMLESVLKNSLWKAVPSGRKEVVVCANGCTDNGKTANAVRSVQREHPEVKLVETRKKGFSFARNLLAQRMDRRADVLFFFDADVLVRRKTMEALYRALAGNPKIDVAAAQVVPAAKFVDKRFRKGFAVGAVEAYDQSMLQPPAKRISGAGYAVRGSVIRAIKLPESLQGGVDLYLTLKIGRNRVARVREAQVVHRTIGSIVDFKRQRLRSLVGKAQLKALFPEEEFGAEQGRWSRIPLKERLLRFAGMPDSQKASSLGANAMDLVAKAQAKLAIRRLKKGKPVDVWKPTVSDKLHRRRR